MKFAQPKILLQDNRLDGFHHHGAHILDDDGDSTAGALGGLVRVGDGGGLNVAQDARKTKGVTTLADACTDKVTETDGTDNIIFADCYALLNHSHRFPAHAMVRSVKGILVHIHL